MGFGKAYNIAVVKYPHKGPAHVLSCSIMCGIVGSVLYVLADKLWALPILVKTEFPWVASRANMLYLAARTHNRATSVVRLHEAHIAALREF